MTTITATNNTVALALQQGNFMINMPDEAPPLGFDVNDITFDWTAVYPSNYWNLEELEAKHNALGGWPVLTAKHVSIEPVIDPEEKEPDLSPKIVLYFAERVPALVCNRTRCKQLSQIAGTRNPALWIGRLPRLEVYAGVERSMSMSQQILVRAAPPEETGSKFDDVPTEKLAEDLFA